MKWTVRSGRQITLTKKKEKRQANDKRKSSHDDQWWRNQTMSELYVCRHWLKHFTMVCRYTNGASERRTHCTAQEASLPVCLSTSRTHKEHKHTHVFLCRVGESIVHYIYCKHTLDTQIENTSDPFPSRSYTPLEAERGSLHPRYWQLIAWMSRVCVIVVHPSLDVLNYAEVPLLWSRDGLPARTHLQTHTRAHKRSAHCTYTLLLSHKFTGTLFGYAAGVN